MLVNFILIILRNREYSLVIPNQEPTEDISDLFSLLFISVHTEVIQDVIHDNKDNYNDDDVMDYINKYESLSSTERDYTDDNLADEEAEDLEEARKERMEMKAD